MAEPIKVPDSADAAIARELQRIRDVQYQILATCQRYDRYPHGVPGDVMLEVADEWEAQGKKLAAIGANIRRAVEDGIAEIKGQGDQG